jgi:hypothetical protein
VDSSDNVYMVGYSDAAWSDGNTIRNYTSGKDAFVTVINYGTVLWNTFLGGDNDDYGNGIAMDGSGNVYVTGSSNSTWGDNPVRAFTSNSDAFVAKLNSSGNLTWNTFLGGNASDIANSIALDGSNNIYVAGNSDATWGSPLRSYTSGGDAFAAKLDSSGTLTWNMFLGGSGGDVGSGIAVDGSSNVYVAGNSDASWGSPKRSYTLGKDAFAAKIPSAPTLIELISFTAEQSGKDVVLKWETESEIDNAGFRIWRSDAAGQHAKIVSSLIPAEGNPTQGEKYAWTDWDVPAGTWLYYLEDIDNSGASSFHGPVSVIDEASRAAR